jgi:hypothetical protein
MDGPLSAGQQPWNAAIAPPGRVLSPTLSDHRHLSKTLIRAITDIRQTRTNGFFCQSPVHTSRLGMPVHTWTKSKLHRIALFHLYTHT